MKIKVPQFIRGSQDEITFILYLLTELLPSSPHKIFHNQPMSSRSEGREKRSGNGMGVSPRMLVFDLAMAFMWVWSGAIVKIVLSRWVDPTIVGNHGLDFLRYTATVLLMFLFAWLGIITRGAAYNPLSVLSDAIKGDLSTFVLTLFGRIPSQVFSC